MKDNRLAHCCVCNKVGVTNAHVKDKSICESEGIHDHTFTNIIQMCYTCHYEYFDQKRMGIRKTNDGKIQFIRLNQKNEIEIFDAKCIVNVRDSNIDWKNKRCLPKLRIYMKKRMTN